MKNDKIYLNVDMQLTYSELRKQAQLFNNKVKEEHPDEFFNEEGVFIRSRKMTPTEKKQVDINDLPALPEDIANY